MCLRHPHSLFRYLLFLSMYLFFHSPLHATADPAPRLAPRLALGLDGHGGGFVEILNSDFSNQTWRKVNWSGYNSANGETRPTWCDVDGDGKQELLIGLGSGGAGWLNILDDADTDYASLSWVQVPWAAYNSANGETFPACGDLDGDGKDELAIGLGSGGAGYVAILDDANAGYPLLSWVRVNWSSYTDANGIVHPAAGNLDDDNADELILGLGEGGGGWLQIVDDASHSFSTLKWIQGSWGSYNTARGETFPILCDVDGDDKNELLLGMGAGASGYMEVLDNPATPSTTPTTLGWPRVSWASYNQANGATYPTCGDLDGDGRDELLVGLGEGGSGYYVALDDSPSGFASLGWQRGHWAGYNNQTGAIRPTLSTPSSTGSGLQFDLTGAISLQALDDIVEETEDSRRRRRSGQRGTMTYRVVSEGDQRGGDQRGGDQREENQREENQRETGNHRQGRNTAAILVSGGNLLAMDENGQTRTVILSSHPAKVMYVVAGERREFVYLALDVDASSALVAAENCAIFRVSLTDNSHSCLQEGVYLQAMDEAFIQRFGGRIKPIQRGGEGQIYFAGSPFSVPLSGTDNGITQADWHPLVYRHDPASGTTEAITHDALNIVFFLVLEDGGLIYQGSNTLDAQEKLWLYQAPYSTDLSQAPPAFFFRDTDRSLFWGGHDRNTQPGLFFARPLQDMAGAERAFLPTSLPSGQAMMADQVIIGDNGRLYGVFSQAGEGVLIHQLLPFASENTARFDQPVGGIRNITPTQVARGYIYFMDRYDPSDFRGTKDVIRKKNMATGEVETLLDEGRYEIFTWRVSGHRLYFSGQDKDTTTLIFGWIDTLAVRLGRPVEAYLTLQEVASALGTASEVRDIEILLPQEPPTDPGYAPDGTLFANDAHSLSLEFDKYMDKTSVEENVVFQSSDGDNVDLMKIWFYRTLHMIPDLDEGGLGDGQGSTPLTGGLSYTLAIDGARDSYGWELMDAAGDLGIHATVTVSGDGSTGASPSDLSTTEPEDQVEETTDQAEETTETTSTLPSDVLAISAIEDQAAMSGETTDPIAFEVSDPNVHVAFLTVTATSSNNVLIPEEAMELDGSRRERTIRITPVSGQSGEATITMVVSNGEQTSQTAFVLRVNSRPTITAISDQLSDVNGSTEVVAFTVDDLETAGNDLVVTASSSNATLVLDENIVLDNRSANRALFVEPEAGQSGQAIITLTVQDSDGATATERFTVTVLGTYTNSLGMAFREIPAGTFTMGSPRSESGRDSNEGPQHRVTISQPFYMGTTEVTQGQWREVMGSNPSSFSSCGDECPVEQVSWDDAQSFIAALNTRGEGSYRLPTEAEWEYAARAGTTTAYSFGDDAGQLGEYAWYNSNASGTTHPVATKRANPWGLYDMHGNVWEWVQDRYGSFAASTVTDPTGPSSGSDRAGRGGRWDSGPADVRSAHRGYCGPDGRLSILGLRLSRTYP